MIILSIRTDQAESEIALFKGQELLDQIVWQAHRILADTIHKKISTLLSVNQKTLNDVEGIICYVGPGSFTGLRIGLTVGNTFASALNIPITGSSKDDWQTLGIKKLMAGGNDKVVLPQYGAEAKTTKPKK
jgi:tRNA threonylcarbamoyladenosine biosynthesis protein TsaB